VGARFAIDEEGCISGLALDVGKAIVISEFPELGFPDQAQIFERIAGVWTQAAHFDSPEFEGGRVPGRYGPAVAIRGNLALVAGSRLGTHVYRRDASGWRAEGNLADPDNHDFGYRNVIDIRITDDYVIQIGGNLNRNARVGHVYRQQGDGSFEHLANLVTDEPNGLVKTSVYRNLVIGQRGSTQLEFELPADFGVKALEQEDFESGAAPEWAPLPASRFSIVKSDRTFVYRQLNVAGTTGAIHSANNVNQSVTADIAPRVLKGAGAEVGLTTRYVDPDNFYYAALRNDPDRVILGRWVRGVETEFGERAVDVSVGSRYRLTLESSGSHHVVYLDGRRLADAYDGALFRGHAGVRMFNATADFDNLVVSPGPVADLTNHDPYTTAGYWSDEYSRSFRTFLLDDSLLLTGETRVDGVVQSLVTLNEFGGSSGADFGLVVRYVDADNYLFATIRGTNKLYLRKVVNGVVTQIGGVNLAATPGATFVLRLEAVGDRLRVYVNNLLRVETAGIDSRAGRVGAFAHDADVLFASYQAYEP
jgi:hypothetical protein